MQADAEISERSDLIFRVRRMRSMELPMAVPVRPLETSEGMERGVIFSI